MSLSVYICQRQALIEYNCISNIVCFTTTANAQSLVQHIISDVANINFKLGYNSLWTTLQSRMAPQCHFPTFWLHDAALHRLKYECCCLFHWQQTRFSSARLFIFILAPLCYREMWWKARVFHLASVWACKYNWMWRVSLPNHHYYAFVSYSVLFIAFFRGMWWNIRVSILQMCGHASTVGYVSWRGRFIYWNAFLLVYYNAQESMLAKGMSLPIWRNQKIAMDTIEPKEFEKRPGWGKALYDLDVSIRSLWL